MWYMYMYKRKVIKNDYFTSFRKKENIIIIFKCFKFLQNILN